MKYYHYTHEDRLETIIKSGVIKLSTANVFARDEKAIAWVSTNAHWENTVSLKPFEKQLAEQGCARIEVEADGFYTWSKLKHLAKMNLEIAGAMENVGIEAGGNPSEWFGSLTPIDINRWIRAEVYENGEWVEYDVFEY